MPIDCTTPTVVPAIPERTYPYWYLVDLRIDASRLHESEPRQRVTATAVLRKCRYLQDGTPDFSPGGERSLVTIPDFLALAGENQLAATCFANIVSLIVEQGTDQGVL
ncbi:hypothetical protein GYB59_15280 [bacterium]|nr:hypothetical protein [bacterium]